MTAVNNARCFAYLLFLVCVGERERRRTERIHTQHTPQNKTKKIESHLRAGLSSRDANKPGISRTCSGLAVLRRVQLHRSWAKICLGAAHYQSASSTPPHGPQIDHICSKQIKIIRRVGPGISCALLPEVIALLFPVV